MPNNPNPIVLPVRREPGNEHLVRGADHKLLCSCRCEQTAAALVRMLNGSEADRRDAARWRFIKNKAWGQERMNGIWGPILSFDIRLPATEVNGDLCSAFVQAIDAALAAGENRE
jgi:hypothetical protein